MNTTPVTPALRAVFWSRTFTRAVPSAVGAGFAAREEAFEGRGAVRDTTTRPRESGESSLRQRVRWPEEMDGSNPARPRR
ncbi:hypothetical protein ACWDMY_26865, partial [Streptomyces globisporus]